MKKTAVIMGMPVIIEILDKNAKESDIDEVFSYFVSIDEKFSPYKNDSEVSKINRKEIDERNYSKEMKYILKEAARTKKETNGYFEINLNGKFDPSGIVKGYAIFEGSRKLKIKGFKNYYVEIAGDIQVSGTNTEDKPWKVGIRNPFNQEEIVKVVNISDNGIATSGNYIRGKHIFNPVSNKEADEIASISVIAKNVYDADRYATAAFAMGEKGIYFLDKLKGVEGYMITKDKKAVYTKNFEKFVIN